MITWTHRFTSTDPTTFKTGDIVEVQTTISVVPVKKDQFRMIINMRALAMLDNGPSIVSTLHIRSEMLKISNIHMWQKADSRRLQAVVIQAPIKAPLKRKVGYAEIDDQVVEARRKMNNMAMNERD